MTASKNIGMGLATLGFAILVIAMNSSDNVVQDDSAMRQRCYVTGWMHGDDDTDPSVFGLSSNAACRKSYFAGHSYFQNMMISSNNAMKER